MKTEKTAIGTVKSIKYSIYISYTKPWSSAPTNVSTKLEIKTPLKSIETKIWK